MKPFEYKISTMTLSASYGDNVALNLTNIGKYLELDKNIIGLKYDFNETSILKGKYLTSVYKKSKTKNINKINTKLFYNQISLIVNVGINIVNVKLFANGSLHLTGIKNSSEAKIIMDLILERLNTLKHKNVMVLLTLDNNNIYLDNHNMIYSKSNPKYIMGYKKSDELVSTYVINKKTYTFDTFTNCFVSLKIEAKRTRSRLDLNGNNVGHTKIELLKNKLKLYKKNSNINFDIHNIQDIHSENPFYLIYYDGENHSSVIGKVVYYFKNNIKPKMPFVKMNIIEYNYSCDPFKSFNENDRTEYIDINCINIYFNINMQINRQRLFTKFIEFGYNSEYKPEKYSGVKLLYKFNATNDNGKCTCDKKCTCNNITFLIFQSGNIIVTGFKSIEQISGILKDFQDLFNSIEHIVKKRIL